MKYNISVIVPIYGVENYIANCAESLFGQTLTEGVEFIFVNDATKDSSIRILEGVLSKYPELKDQVRIIEHLENKGLPGARNTGLANAIGEYIVHVDGDDFCEPTMLEKLYSSAKENDADFVWCDYYITFGSNRRIIKQPTYPSSLEAVKGMLRGAMKYNVWNKMCRRSLYVDNNLHFPEGRSMGEDMTMILVALYSRKCSYVGEPLYNYVQSASQMTAVYTPRKLTELKENCSAISAYIDEKFKHLGLEREYSALHQLMKWPFLLDGKYSSYKRWKEWFPESNKFIWQTKGVNTRIKLVEWSAAKGFFPLIWLHYLLVIRIFYGIVYR